MSFSQDRLSIFQHSKSQLPNIFSDPKSINQTITVVKIERPDKNIKVSEVFDDSNETLISSSDQLRILYKETIESLKIIESKNDRLQSLIRPETLLSKKVELRTLIAEIENYANENQINLKDIHVNQTQRNNKLNSVKQQIQNLKSLNQESQKHNLSSSTPSNEFVLTNQLEISQKELVIRKLQVLYEKLRKMDMVIGDQNVFREHSVSALLEEEMDSLQMLDKVEIQRNSKKVEFVMTELNNTQNESKKHLVDLIQRKEITDFLADFLGDFPESKLDNVSKLVYTTVDNIETHSSFLNKLTKKSEGISKYRELLMATLIMSEENKEALKNLSLQTKMNIDVLKQNKNLLGK